MSPIETDYEAPPRLTSDGTDPDRFALIDIVETMVREGRRIITYTFAAGVLAVLVSLILPSWYVSETTIFGPEDASETRRVISTLRNLSIPGMRQNVSAQSPETFIAVLESRNLRERIIERFGLMKAYRQRKLDDCVKLLERRVTVELENTGIIRVSVRDRDKERAAGIANAMIEELDNVNVELRIYKARRARQYLEAQLGEVRARLSTAEESLAAFQQTNLAVSIDEQAKAALEAVAELQAQATELRIKKGVLASYASETNPELTVLDRELAQVEGQLHTIEFGDGDDLSISRLPTIGRVLGQHLREVKVAETLLGLLTEDYEQARLSEAKETPVVQILDRALPAERRDWPRRSLIVLSAMAITFLGSIAFTIAASRYRALATETERRRWSSVFSRAGSWFRRRARAS